MISVSDAAIADIKDPINSDDNLLGDVSVTDETKNTVWHRVAGVVRRNVLLLMTVLAIILGLGLGVAVYKARPSKDALMWLGLPGEMFLRMLKMMILPLIISNIITGTAKVGAKSNGKMSAISLVYVISTNIISCLIGLILSLAITPGSGTTRNTRVADRSSDAIETQDIFADLIRNLFPSNLVYACTHKVQTQYKTVTIVELVNTSRGLVNVTRNTVEKSLGYAEGSNLIGLIVCCVLVGVATSMNRERSKPFLNFFMSLSEIVVTVLHWLLWYTPIGVLSLMVASIASVDDLPATFVKVGLFVATVSAGLGLHQICLLPLLYFCIERKNPLQYYVSHIPAWVTGFVSTSGAMAIPDMLQGCEERQHYDKRVTRFTIPFVTTLNADGSAMFIVCATMFMAQVTGYDLNTGQIVVVVCLTAMAVMALPSVPSSSIVTTIVILTTLNVPTSEVGLLFTIDWLLDRLRTTSNVLSHAMSVPVVNHFIIKDLKAQDEVSVEENDNVKENISLNSIKVDK